MPSRMTRTLTGAAAGVLAFVLACEIVMRLLPVSSATNSGYTIDPNILTYAPNLIWRYSTGWDLRNPQSLTTNNLGFVSDHDFKRDQEAVALIGDSFIEAASLDRTDRPGAQLERALGGHRPVYAMGAAGTSLLDYAERIRYAHEHLGIRDFVLLVERGDVRQALCGSGNVASQCLDPTTLVPRTHRRAPPSIIKRLLRESAFARYLAGQLKISPTRLLSSIFERRIPNEMGDAGEEQYPQRTAETDQTTALDAVVHNFFERAKPHVTGRLVIVVDADRGALMQGRSLIDPDRQRFIKLSRDAGATVVDAEPIFQQHFDASALSLDVGPYDGHMNALGVRLVARAAALALAGH